MKTKLLRRVREFVNDATSIDGWVTSIDTVVGVNVSYKKPYKYLSDLRRDYVIFSDASLIEKKIYESLHLAAQAYWEKEGREYWRKKLKKK